MMRSVIWLFGQIKQFIRNCRRRCNCAEIDMRCYFNRSFPSTQPLPNAGRSEIYIYIYILLAVKPYSFPAVAWEI